MIQILLLVVFVSDFQVFVFYYVLLSVIPTPWTDMMLDGGCKVPLNTDKVEDGAISN